MASRFNPARDCVDMKPFIACYARRNGEQVGSSTASELPSPRIVIDHAQETT